MAHRVRRTRGFLRLVSASGLMLAITTLAWQAWHWPDVAALATHNPSSTAFIERYRAAETAAGRRPRLAWNWVSYGAISPNLKRAVLVAEDITFFSHRGFELSEVQSAVERAVEEGSMPRGASTITQQLAKNLWLSPSRSPLRKAREAILTWQIERHLSKRRILELYLNVAEFGRGVYGAEAASRHYFSKPARDLDEDQAAQLAASLPNPARWHPGAPGSGYRRYVETIRRRMARAELPTKFL